MSAFAGAIFSPINAGIEEVKEQIALGRQTRGQFENILDPQLYVPASERGHLKEWAYYPKDVDTADLTSSAWWSALNEKLTRACESLGLDSLCSPTVIPKVFDDKYYTRTVQVGSELAAHHRDTKTGVLQTALVNLPELADANRPLELASIISRTKAERIYLIFVGTTEPRRELNQADELVGAMRLIYALETNGVPVIVRVLFFRRPAVESRRSKFLRLGEVFQSQAVYTATVRGTDCDGWRPAALLV